MWRCVLALALVTPSQADSVVDEVSVGDTFVANRLAGEWNVDDGFAIGADVAITRAAGTSTSASVSAAYAGERWSIAVVGAWVPAQTTASTASLVVEDLGDELVLAEAELSATTSSTSVLATLGYAGDVTSVAFTLGLDHVQSQQTFASIIDDAGRMLTAQDVRALCTAGVCDPEIEAALWPLWSQLSQITIGAGIAHAEDDDLELALDASYFVYDKDPTSAGYFRLPGIGPSHLGDGIAIAPLRYAVAPSLTHRRGKLAATLGLAYGSYLGDGFELGVRTKASYRFGKLGVFVKLASSWNVEAGELSRALSFAFGGMYSW